MSRYKWFRTEWPISIRELTERLKEKNFNDASNEGFVIDRERDDFVEARFIERIAYTENVLDPFGNVLSFDRVEFKQCEFRAAISGPGLELLDAPRGTQGLVSRLIEVCSFSLAISPISVDVLAWADAFQEVANAQGIVDSLQIGSLELASGINAKAVIKGVTDVRIAGGLLTNGKRHTLEKIQLRFNGLRRGTVQLTNLGTARIEVDDPSDLILALRQSIAAVSVGNIT